MESDWTMVADYQSGLQIFFKWPSLFCDSQLLRRPNFCLRAFDLVVCFSLWVREVLSSILEMPLFSIYSLKKNGPEKER